MRNPVVGVMDTLASPRSPIIVPLQFRLLVASRVDIAVVQPDSWHGQTSRKTRSVT